MGLRQRGFLLVLAFLCLGSQAATRFVDSDCASPTPPYESWATAAVQIDDALRNAPPGTLILVTNGVYRTGGRLAEEQFSRVVLDRPLKLKSVHGPEVTRIEGGPRIRCAFLVEGATLDGFTLSGGNAVTGGGVCCRGTASDGLVTNCVIIGNQGEYGGETWGGRIVNCRVEGNTGINGGGSSGSRVSNSLITGNLATHEGGGAVSSFLTNCTVVGNRALSKGGGVTDSSLFNSIVYHNSSLTFSNHLRLTDASHSCTTPLPPGDGNLAEDPGLASVHRLASLSPCIRTGSGAFAFGHDLEGEPWESPPCIGADQFSDAASSSPLKVGINAQRTRFGPGVVTSFKAEIEGSVTHHVWDFGDGITLTNQPFVFHAWTAPGLHLVRLTARRENPMEEVTAVVRVEVPVLPTLYVNQANPVPAFPYESWETAATTIQDAVDASESGQRIVVADGIYQTGGRAIDGLENRVAVERPLRLESVHGPSVTIIRGGRDRGFARGVHLASGAVLSGFTVTSSTIWMNGAPGDGGGIHCEPGAVVTNCWIIDNLCDGRQGGGVWGGSLHRCRLSRNMAGLGGGAYGSILHDCVITENVGGFGGGVSEATLYRCTIVSNTASALRWNFGGGAASSILYHCLLTHNGAMVGGGAASSELHHCTVADNLSVPFQALPGTIAGGVGGCRVWNSIVRRNTFKGTSIPANFDTDSVLEATCTEPLPNLGARNLTLDPRFVDAPEGDYSLRPDSPCIDAAIPVDPPLPSLLDMDIEGKPRPLDGQGDGIAGSDLGAFEFLRPESDTNRDGIPDGWTWLHALDPTAPDLARADPDQDGVATEEEWSADTDPRDAASLFRLSLAALPERVRITFPASKARVYTLESTPSAEPTRWQSVVGQADQAGQGITMSFFDALSSTSRLYRVRVRLP